MACDGSKYFKDLEDYVINLKQRVLSSKKRVPIKPFPTPKVEIYQAKGAHTPFQEKAVNTKSSGGVTLLPLNAYPLNVLRLIGTLVQGNQSFGVILAPDNKVYQISVGDSIGDHYGTVNKITNTQVEVTEPIEENGKKSHRIVTLQLKDQS